MPREDAPEEKLGRVQNGMMRAQAHVARFDKMIIERRARYMAAADARAQKILSTTSLY